MASSELVLAPVVDRNALKKTQMQTQLAMTEAGKKASIETRKNLKHNIERGSKEGFDRGINASMPKLKMIGAAVAVAAGAVIADTLDKTLGTLDENIDRIMGKMESIREIALNAAAFGITSERYAAMSVMATSAGMDQGDLQGIMAGYVAALKDPEMEKFQKMAKTKGMEASFFNFLASTGTLSEQERQQRLIGVFGEDDMRLVSRFLQPMMQMQKSGQQLSLQNLFQTMTGTQLDLPSLRRGMGRTAAAQQAVTAQQTTQLLAQLTTGVTPGQAAAVTAVAESKARVDAARMTTLDLQVKTRIIADNLEIKQIEAGRMAITETFDYGSDVSRFAQDPSLQTYLPTIPMFRWWTGNMQGSGNPADGAMGLVSSGAGKSLLNMPMDFVTKTISDINDKLTEIMMDGKENKERENAAQYDRGIMAINGKYPTLLVGMVDALNSTESARLNALLALKNPNDAQITEINALKAKAEIPSALAPRMPIVLDGDVIKAKPDGYQTTMSKSMQVYGDNTIGTKSTANTVTINIQTKSSKTDVSVFPDIICSIADIIFSKKDSVPRISYFGDNVIIPDGWLVRLSRSQRANSEIETISLEIQKNLETVIPGEKEVKPDQVVYETTDMWS